MKDEEIKKELQDLKTILHEIETQYVSRTYLSNRLLVEKIMVKFRLGDKVKIINSGKKGIITHRGIKVYMDWGLEPMFIFYHLLDAISDTQEYTKIRPAYMVATTNGEIREELESNLKRCKCL